MESDKHITKILVERKIVDRMGLFPYVTAVMARRWTDRDMGSNYIFAIPKDDSPLMRSCDSNLRTIGNPSYLCTIMIVDPGMSIVVVIVNKPYAFVEHCLPPEMRAETLHIALITNITKAGAPLTIIAIDHTKFDHCSPRERLHAINIPRAILHIVRGVIAPYCAFLDEKYDIPFRDEPSRDDSSRDEVIHDILISYGARGTGLLNARDFCPLSGSHIAVNNFKPYFPSIWNARLRMGRDLRKSDDPLYSSRLQVLRDESSSAHPTRSASSPPPTASSFGTIGCERACEHTHEQKISAVQCLEKWRDFLVVASAQTQSAPS